MKIKTAELIGPALDWTVAKCEEIIIDDAPDIGFILESAFIPSTDWAQGGPIIEREDITVVRCDDDCETDRQGYATSKRIPVWAAVHGVQHGQQTLYSSYGEPWGEVYGVDADTAIVGPHPINRSHALLCSLETGR